MMSTVEEKLRELAEGRAPGPPASFTKLHVLKAIWLLAEQGTIGRASLAQKLGLGEGVTRTLLKRLLRAGLVRTSRSGCEITEEGRALWEELRRKLARIASVRWTGELGQYGVAVLVKGGASKVRLGVEQRDEAIRAGAKGALVLVLEGGRLRMPGVSEDIRVDYPELFEEITTSLEPEEGDAVVVAYADDAVSAEYGALAAALDLL